MTRAVTGFGHTETRMQRISGQSRFTRHPDLHKNPRPAGFEIYPATVGMFSLKTETRAAFTDAAGR
jgi:hypothetical protein